MRTHRPKRPVTRDPLMQAEALGFCLDQDWSGDKLSRVATRGMARIADRAYQIAAGAALACAQAEAARPPGTHLINGYMERVFRACTTDPRAVD